MKVKDIFNEILLPIKLLIPQPAVARIPGLTTNQDIRIKQVLRYVKGRCLDIGCGDNRLIQEYKARGGDGIGIDIYPWDGVDLVVEDSSNLPFPDSCFDTVTFVACLNHIPRRVDILREAHRVLEDDGVVIITFLQPAISTIWHKICFWDKDQKLRGMKEGEVYGFTRRQIGALLQTAGFRIIKKGKFSWGLNNLYVCAKNQV